ncbi:MAG: peptidoglycan DD-metalloendopeptidase family protein [Hyphomonadaceae bacterium]
MRTRIAISGLMLGLTLGVAACDGSVKWPGFETPEPAPNDTVEVNVPAAPAPDTGSVPTEIETPEVETPEAEIPAEVPDETPAETPDIDTPVDSDPVENTGDPDTGQESELEGTTPDESPNDAEDTVEPAPDTPTETTPEETPPPAPIVPPAFSYHAPGTLLAGSGTGSPDRTVFAPDMVFPILSARAYPQSMVWKFGGGIGGGDECDARNYEYPWQDNFCEKRTRDNGTPSCPVARVHLGQDIRVGDAAGCNAMRREYRDNPQGIARYRVVAAEDGVISNIGRYTVSLRSGPRIYRYLHMNMRALQVSLGDTISAGQHLGYVSKDFGGTPTTFHLHFEIKVSTPDGGWEYVPPYTSLVESYARREQAPGEEIPRAVGVASTGLPIPEGFIITE